MSDRHRVDATQPDTKTPVSCYADLARIPPDHISKRDNSCIFEQLRPVRPRCASDTETRPRRSGASVSVLSETVQDERSRGQTTPSTINMPRPANPASQRGSRHSPSRCEFSRRNGDVLVTARRGRRSSRGVARLVLATTRSAPTRTRASWDDRRMLRSRRPPPRAERRSTRGRNPPQMRDAPDARCAGACKGLIFDEAANAQQLVGAGIAPQGVPVSYDPGPEGCSQYPPCLRHFL